MKINLAGLEDLYENTILLKLQNRDQHDRLKRPEGNMLWA